MRIVFFGTPIYSDVVLNHLIDQGVDIVAIVTRPDKPRGRSQKMQPTPVKITAQKRLPDVPIFQPKKASTPEFCQTLLALKPDLFVVVAYGEIIKQMLLDVPPLGCINVHYSLLPKWRGAAPMQHSLMNGDQKTGVTIIEMVLAMDAGDILGTTEIPISEDMTLGDLSEKLCQMAPPLLLDVMEKIESKTIAPEPQDASQITLAPKITPEMCRIDFSKTAREIHNQIRGLSPKPGAYTTIEVHGTQKRLKILRSCVSDEPAGYSKSGWILATPEGHLKLLQVQPEGKKAMDIKSFIAGNPCEPIIYCF